MRLKFVFATSMLLLLVGVILKCEKQEPGDYLGKSELIPIAQISKWRYADTSGNIVISPRFQYAYRFSEGLAYVNFVDGSSGLINRTGDTKLILEEKYAHGVEKILMKFDHFFELQSGYLIIRLNSGKYTYLSAVGELLQDQGFDWAEPISEGLGAFCNSCTMGHMGIVSGGRWGFLDLNGNVKIEPIYEEVGKFSEGLAAAKKNNKWGYINQENEWVIEPRYDIADVFSESLAVVGYLKDNSYSYTYIDRNGEKAFDKLYDSAWAFINGIAIVWIKDGYQYINKRAEVIIPESFDEAYPFYKNRAIVSSSDTYLIINIDGQIIANLPYIYVAPESFSKHYSGLGLGSTSDKTEYFNETGKVILQFH